MFAPLTAVSPDSTLLAVHSANDNDNGNDQGKGKQQRVMIKCYDASVSLSSLKFTLSAKVGAHRLDVLKFISSQHLLAGSTAHNELYVFDVQRGVHSHTIQITQGQLRSVAVSSSMSSSSDVYVLVHRDGKLLGLQYDLFHKTVVNAKGGDVAKATLKKKIKLGSCDEDDVHTLAMAVIHSGAKDNDDTSNTTKELHLAVRCGKRIKVINAQDGKTSYKLKLKSTPSSNGASNDDDQGASGHGNAYPISPSGTSMNVSHDGTLLTAATATGLHFFSTVSKSNIGTCSNLPNVRHVSIRSQEGHIVLANCHESSGGESSSHLFHVQEEQSKKNNARAFATLSPPPLSSSSKNDASTTVLQSFFSKQELIMTELSKVGFQNVNVQMTRLSYRKEDDDGKESFLRGNLYPADNEEEGHDNDGGEQSSKSKKRKTNIVLGPGEAGGESLTVTDGIKRARTREDDNDHDGKAQRDNDEDMDFELEPEDDDEDGNKEGGGSSTIAQRLALLSSELEREDYSDDEEGGSDNNHWRNMSTTTTASGEFAVRNATSDSLLILLRQALRSNDDAQLEVALQVSDKRVIENSIMALQRECMQEDENASNDDDDADADADSELMVMLLTKLVTRISRKPARATQLQFWIRTVLVALLSSSSSTDDAADGWKMGKVQKDIAARLAPLRSMLSERVESLPALLRLEGRLSLIGRVE